MAGPLAKQGKTIKGLTLADAAAIYNRDYFLPSAWHRVSQHIHKREH